MIIRKPRSKTQSSDESKLPLASAVLKPYDIAACSIARAYPTLYAIAV